MQVTLLDLVNGILDHIFRNLVRIVFGGAVNQLWQKFVDVNQVQKFLERNPLVFYVAGVHQLLDCVLGYHLLHFHQNRVHKLGSVTIPGLRLIQLIKNADQLVELGEVDLLKPQMF